MTDDDEPKPDPNEPSPEPARAVPLEPKRGFMRRHWGTLSITTVVLLPALIFTIWAGIALSYSYSDGKRVGYVQKLSRKGWLCKTWEVELQISNIPGSAPILFQFTVRSDSVARAIEALEGRQVAIHYEQHV